MQSSEDFGRHPLLEVRTCLAKSHDITIHFQVSSYLGNEGCMFGGIYINLGNGDYHISYRISKETWIDIPVMPEHCCGIGKWPTCNFRAQLNLRYTVNGEFPFDIGLTGTVNLSVVGVVSRVENTSSSMLRLAPISSFALVWRRHGDRFAGMCHLSVSTLSCKGVTPEDVCV